MVNIILISSLRYIRVLLIMYLFIGVKNATHIWHTQYSNQRLRSKSFIITILTTRICSKLQRPWVRSHSWRSNCWSFISSPGTHWQSLSNNRFWFTSHHQWNYLSMFGLEFVRDISPLNNLLKFLDFQIMGNMPLKNLVLTLLNKRNMGHTLHTFLPKEN